MTAPARRKRQWGVAHAAFFLIVVSSVFWLAWYWLLLVFILLRVQDAVLGGCILTKWEYGSYERRYTQERVGHLFPKKVIRFLPLLIDWIVPTLLVYAAYLIQ